MKLRLFSSIVVTVFLLAALSVAGSLAPTTAVAGEPLLPIVFVHGFSGSAAQYETQALRWASNNYPNVVTGIDRMAPSVMPTNDQLDAFFDAVMAETGNDQIYVVAHSAGTSIMVGYLNSSPERTARVAKYINIDGAGGPPGTSCPGNPAPVNCLNIARNTSRTMGPNNIHPVDYGHTQCVTSDESFVWQYEFLMEKAPATTLILPDPPGQVKIAGRALNYAASTPAENTGIKDATLQLWEVNSATGARKYSTPDVQVVLDATGNFGPWPVNGQQRYEINVIRQPATGPPRQNHFYYEPFMRSNYLLRLNIAPIGSPLSETIRSHTGPHTGVSVVRPKEWWGNNTLNPTNVDVLNITTTTPNGVYEAGNVVTAGTAPYTASTISMIIVDVGSDGVTHTDALFPLGPFLSGIDVYMPAPADPPNGKITFAHQQRGTNHPQVINTPNWTMEADHYMSVNFRNYVQEINTWGECKRAKPSPCK